MFCAAVTSTTLEGRRGLAQERSHGVPVVLGAAGELHHLALDVERLVDAVPGREGQRTPDRAVADRSSGCPLYGESARPAGNLFGRYHLGGQPELQRLRGSDLR